MKTPVAANLDTEPRIERIGYGDAARPPLMSVIVPTLDGERRGLLAQLIRALGDQSLPSFELLLVIGDRRQGRAINRAVQVARAPQIATMDDDTVIGTPWLLEILHGVLERHAEVGMVGASTVVPPGASWLQRVASRQIPRRLFPVVETLTDSDMVQHPCLAMRRCDFLRIGGEDEELIRGLDPLLRHKVRQAGQRVVIAPHCYVCHPLPDSFVALLRMYFRNGRGSAFAQRRYPERIFNLTDGFGGNDFPARVSFTTRVLRFPLRLARAFVRGQWIRLATDLAYAAGHFVEWTSRRRESSAQPAAAK
ncbi:MAG: hypothetical protein ACKVX7_01260 [Planctomycetota bacterium]